MSDFKILALRADEGGCGHFRTEMPAKYARMEGVEIEVLDHLPADIMVSKDRVVDVKRVNTDADVIIFQRPLLGAFSQAIDQAHRQGITCIGELDDDLAAIHPDNFAYREVVPRGNPDSNWNHLKNNMSKMDMVIASTPSIAARYGTPGKTRVLRNVLPESTWNLERSALHSPVRVGWTGSLITHPADLELAGTHIGSMLRTTDTVFTSIGDPEGVAARLFISESKFKPMSWRPLDEFHAAIAENIDIGIAPLEDSLFNRGKSWLKPLEFSACGVPWVASPTDEYLELHKLGIGTIARRGIEWQKALKKYVNHPDYLLEESNRVREATRHLTYENRIGDWIDAWKAGMENFSRTSR